MTQEEYKKFINQINKYMTDFMKILQDSNMANALSIYYEKEIEDMESCLNEQGQLDISKLKDILKKIAKNKTYYNINKKTKEKKDKEKDNAEEIQIKEDVDKKDKEYIENQNPQDILLKREYDENKKTEGNKERDQIKKEINIFVNNIKKLKEKDQKRLLAVFLTLKNKSAFYGSLPPSKMPTKLYKRINDQFRIKNDKEDKATNIQHISAKQKQEIFEAPYKPFLNILEEIFSDKLYYNGLQMAKDLYNKYKKSFSIKPNRDIQNIGKKIFNGLPKNSAVRKELEKSIRDFRYIKNLRDIPHRFAFLPHDEQLNFTLPCNKYHWLDICLYVNNSLSEDILKEMAAHINTCPICQESYKNILKGLEYRNYRVKQYSPEKIRKFFFYIPHGKNKEKDYKNTLSAKKKLLNKYIIKENKKQKEEKNMETDINYEIAVGCICGNINKYSLNNKREDTKELSFSFGRLDGETICSDISVCKDDIGFLSREQCFIKYDDEKKDWYLTAPANKGKGIIYYISKEDIMKIIQKMNPRKISDKKLKCQNNLKSYFKEFPGGKIYFSDVSLICFLHTSKQNTSLSYKGHDITGIFHPFLGTLPFGWYIDIINKRDPNEVFKSYFNRSII